MIRTLSALWRGLSGTVHPATGPAPRFDDLGEPASAVYAIGDVHGCRAELAALLDHIAQDAGKLGLAPLAVLLGDSIDRGPDPAGVIDLLVSARNAAWVRAIMGNHERMMLDFLQDPLANARWLDAGGFETLRSYGLPMSRTDLTALPGRRARQTVHAHIPDRHTDWLASLPHGIALVMNGRRYMLTHAGYDPALPPAQQRDAVLLWGRGGQDGSPDLCLVQGHIVTDAPDPAANRILVDTGACHTGRLSCLRLCPGLAPSIISLSLPRRPTAHPRQDPNGDLEGTDLGKH